MYTGSFTGILKTSLPRIYADFTDLNQEHIFANCAASALTTPSGLLEFYEK